MSAYWERLRSALGRLLRKMLLHHVDCTGLIERLDGGRRNAHFIHRGSRSAGRSFGACSSRQLVTYRRRCSTAVGFVWMIKAEYVAELMDGHPVADRLDEISRSSEACPAA